MNQMFDVIISSILFILYSIINLLDLNQYVDNFNILDQNQCMRSTMIYGYIAGYYISILKTIIMLFIIFILISIICFLVISIKNIYSDDQQTNIFNIFNCQISRYIMGFIHQNIHFVSLFIILLPLFLLFAIFIYTRTYNQNNVINNNEPNEQINIMKTHKKFIIFLIVSLFITALLYNLYYLYIENIDTKDDCTSKIVDDINKVTAAQIPLRNVIIEKLKGQRDLKEITEKIKTLNKLEEPQNNKGFFNGLKNRLIGNKKPINTTKTPYTQTNTQVVSEEIANTTKIPVNSAVNKPETATNTQEKQIKGFFTKSNEFNEFNNLKDVATNQNYSIINNKYLETPKTGKNLLTQMKNIFKNLPYRNGLSQSSVNSYKGDIQDRI